VKKCWVDWPKPTGERVKEVTKSLQQLTNVMPAIQEEATQKAIQEWMDRATAVGSVEAMGLSTRLVSTRPPATRSGRTVLDHNVSVLDKWQRPVGGWWRHGGTLWQCCPGIIKGLAVQEAVRPVGYLGPQVPAIPISHPHAGPDAGYHQRLPAAGC
jgi:hypothetical protein